MGWSKPLVSMELDDEDKLDSVQPIAMPSKPDFPYGLRICLTGTELSKLGLEPDCDEGEEIDFHANARVTSVTKGEGGCRVELQITEMAVADDPEEGD